MAGRPGERSGGGLIRDSRNSPTVITPGPTMGKTLYRPHRLMVCPDPTEVTSSPAISGVSRSPEMVGLCPFTTCM